MEEIDTSQNPDHSGMAQATYLTSASYWVAADTSHEYFEFGEYRFAEYVRPYLVPDSSKRVLEVGAFPGGFLGAFVREFHFRPDALDYRDDSEFILSNMIHNGIHNCRIFRADFLEWQPDCRYDAVLSHGFIEHFQDFPRVLVRHAAMLAPGGVLVLSLPHLRYFRWWVSRLFWTRAHREEILGTHNLQAMRLRVLERIVRDGCGLEVLESRHCGGMSVYLSTMPGHMRPWMVPLYRLLSRLLDLTKRLPISGRFISPTILIVARKPHHGAPAEAGP